MKTYAFRRTNHVDMILVTRWDRFARNLTQALVQIEKFKEKYQSPEIFTLFNGELHVMKMPPEEAKEQKEKQKKDAQQKNPAKRKKEKQIRGITIKNFFVK